MTQKIYTGRANNKGTEVPLNNLMLNNGRMLCPLSNNEFILTTSNRLTCSQWN